MINYCTNTAWLMMVLILCQRCNMAQLESETSSWLNDVKLMDHQWLMDHYIVAM